MKSGYIYQLEVPHRETVSVRGFLFGEQRDARTCAIVGSTRGNEVQQAYICACIVSHLERLERAGAIARGRSILVIPCINPYSMNILKRFWPADDTDVNRCFPGDAHGEACERIAAAIMRVVSTYTYGVQLCSYHKAGDFLPHVRITRQGPISDESLNVSGDFGLPYVLVREPSTLDTTLLNYAWQAAGTHAFSVYSRATDRLDERSAREVEDAVIRFLVSRQALTLPADELVGPGVTTTTLLEGDLVDVRTQSAAGYLLTKLQAGDRVTQGQELAQVRDAFDAHVLETLRSPVEGRVFFMRNEPLVQQHMVAFRIVPTPGR